MKTFKKSLAVLLTLLMVFSSMSVLMVSVSAANFTVTFYLDSEKTEKYTSKTVADGGKIPSITDPSKDNMIFKGWQKEGELAVETATDLASNEVHEDLDYIAQWQIEKYSVVFDFNGGTAVIDSATKTSYTADFAANDTITAAYIPTKADADFGGWAKTIDGAATSLGKAEGNNGTIQFWAVWNPIGTGTQEGAYTLSEDKATLTITNAATSPIAIPEEFGGEKLTKAGITKIVFESGNLYDVPAETFKGYTGLVTVNGSDYITSLGKSAFEGCTNLKSINLSRVTNIASAEAAFKGDVSLQSISFNDAITKIPASICEGCTGLVRIQGSVYKDINFPTEVTEIGANAFNGCTSIEGLSFGTKLTKIGDAAFAGCTALQSIDLKNVTTLGDSAFEGCKGLASAKMGALKVIGAKAFKDCSGIKSLDLEKIQEVGESAFENCSALEELSFGDDIYQIENYAFFNCPALKQVYFNKGTCPAVGVFCLGFTSKTAKVADFEIICDRETTPDSRASSAAGAKSVYTYAKDNDFYTSYFSYLWKSYSPYMTSFGNFFAKMIPSLFSVLKTMFESIKNAISAYVAA